MSMLIEKNVLLEKRINSLMVKLVKITNELREKAEKEVEQKYKKAA